MGDRTSMREPKKVTSPFDESGLKNLKGGIIANRCKVIYEAFKLHRISLKDLTYALMQYQRMEVDSEIVYTGHKIPPKPFVPAKKASREIWDKYYKDRASCNRAINLNYSARIQKQSVANYQLALQDDDYDYVVGKSWALYILDGLEEGAVARYLNPEAASGPRQNDSPEDLSIEDLELELVKAEKAPLPGRNVKLIMLKHRIQAKYRQLGMPSPVK